MSKYYVISGSPGQFLEWKKRNYPELLLTDQIKHPGDIVFLENVIQLAGISNPKGIFTGTWYWRKDIKEILIQLQVNMLDTNRLDPIKKAWEYLKSAEKPEDWRDSNKIV